MLSAFYLIWAKCKLWIVLLSAATPLVVFSISLYSSPPDSQTGMRIPATLGMILFQIGFLIALTYESHRIIATKPPRRITRIQLHDEFWRGKDRHNRLYIYALNGHRFFEMMSEKDMHISTVHLIVPDVDAIKAYYTSDITVNDRKHAIGLMEKSVEDAKVALEELKTRGCVREYEIRRLGTFPLEFFAIFDGKTCMVGRYLKESIRKTTIGLRSLAWIESDREIIIQHTQYFEEVWKSIAHRVA